MYKSIYCLSSTLVLCSDHMTYTVEKTPICPKQITDTPILLACMYVAYKQLKHNVRGHPWHIPVHIQPLDHCDTTPDRRYHEGGLSKL